MSRLICQLCCGTVLLMILFSHGTLNAADGDRKIQGHPTVSKRWGAYEVHYPAGRWELEVEEDEKDRARFMLHPMSNNDVVLQVMMMRIEVGPDPHYENHPQLFNNAIVLPVVQELADGDESRIHLTAGAAITPSGWYASSRATVLLAPDRAIHIESCHDSHLPTGHFVTALVMTRSQAGQINQDPAFTQKILEAYEIIQSIELDETQAKHDLIPAATTATTEPTH